MSETLTPAQPETPAEFLEGVAATAPSQAAEVIETTETPAEPEPAPKPDKIERRVANLTRKMADADRAREAAERRAEAAEALLRSNDPDATPAPSRQPAADVETRAAQMLAEREFNRRMTEIDNAGKALGADQWEQAKATLTGLGATANTAFLQALAETENPAKIFADLADDTDMLMDLLAKSPAAMAARLGKMDAKLSTPATRPISNAPPPAPKVKASGVAPEPTPYSYPANMSMREYNAMMDKYLPKSLGGKKERS
jgi:hypothetical protein